MTARPKKDDGPPLNTVSWSKRNLKTVYVKPEDKELFRAAATAGGFPSVRDYLLAAHKAYQASKTRS